MKKSIITVIVALVALSGFSQSKYETGMKKAFDLWEEGKSWEAANMFERIAKAEQDNWVPAYYVSQINIINSFGEKDTDKLKTQLKKAQEYLNDTKALSKNNANIMVLEALYYTAWVAHDGQKYGMKYAGKVTELYQKALQLEPDNPMIVLGKAEWEIGTAKYFGQATAPYCDEIQKAIDMIDGYKSKGAFYPKLNKERAMQVLNQNCKK